MNFKGWCDKTGLTPAALSRMWGVSRLSVENWKKGKVPKEFMINKLISMTKKINPPITREMFVPVETEKDMLKKSTRSKYISKYE